MVDLGLAVFRFTVPHTITAKGLLQPPTTATSLLQAIAGFPTRVISHRDILTTTFMPPYRFNTGWPAVALQTSFWLSLGVMLLVWILPGLRREARLASLAFFAGQFCLTTYVGFPVPWYLPTVTFFALVLIARLIDQTLAWHQREPASPIARRLSVPAGWLTISVGGALLVGALIIFGIAGHQLRWQQQLIEDGHRREIGLWLKSHSKTSSETVFLEPLVYIGYHSNLKMLGYPGLSAPEVVEARKRAVSRAYPYCWDEIILDLTPDWLVLRGYEAETIRLKTEEVFERFYSLAKTFDVRPRIEAIPRIAGRGYLTNDGYFEVYRRNPKLTLNRACPGSSRSRRQNPM